MAALRHCHPSMVSVFQACSTAASRPTGFFSYSRQKPLIPCTLCGSQDNMQRVEIKKMLHEWEQRYPGRMESIFSAMCSVVPSHLADTDAFDFASLSREAGEMSDSGL